MTRKTHTIIFVPHARARFRQFQVSSRFLAGLASFVLLSVMVGSLFTVLWFRSFQKNREMSALEAENRDLRGRAATLNSRLETIEKQPAEFEDRTRRLSIVAGLSGIHDPGTGGVGGLTAIPIDRPASGEAALQEAARRGSLLSSRLGLIEARLSSQADQLSLTPTLAPATGILSAGFGSRPDPFTGVPEFHTGLDISAPAGHRIVAPASGTVVRAGWENGYGRFVQLAHGFGITTYYGHMEAIRVAEGQRVRRGDLIGLVGSSGRSTGPHLHYEVLVDGKPVNPLDYITNAF
ncbi:MAG: M23 family peptidase [Acidobacteria bacterium ACB2]|nr:M23 family peptidase [Acidobacteria bacterium ACB2]